MNSKKWSTTYVVQKSEAGDWYDSVIYDDEMNARAVRNALRKLAKREPFTTDRYRLVKRMEIFIR